MRILKFAGVFLLTLLVIILIVFGTHLNSLFTLFENQRGVREGHEWIEKTSSLKGLTEYIGAQPQRVSIASIAVNQADSSILYNTHSPRTMGRLSNIFLVIEYAKEVENGTLNPDEQVSLAAINKYQLPYMDASDHEHALGKLKNLQSQSDSTVALKYLVDASVAYNDLAISDYLLFKLKPDHIEKLLNKLSIEETESPLPFNGLYITLNPHLEHRETQAHFDSLSQLSHDAFNKRVFRNAKRFINDKSYHHRISEIFDEGDGLDIKFTKERDALAFFPKTTAHEMASLMKRIQQKTLISKAISERVQSILGWAQDNERLRKKFKNYGAIYDNRLGMVNGIDFGTSASRGDSFAQAVFFDNLQVAFWLHMSSNLMNQDFEQRLIWDPDLRRATRHQIKQPVDTTNMGRP